MVKRNFRGHSEGCRCGGNETSRNTILVGSNNQNDYEEGKFFSKAVPFLRSDKKIGVGEKNRGGGESCCHINSKYHDTVNKSLDTVMQYT